jgi:small subunit ribosomal protein S4
LIKTIYGIKLQKHLNKTSKKARGFANVVSKLETRLDVIVYRLQFATSLAQARDLITKGFIKVNSKPVTYAGHFVARGSSITSTNITSALNRIQYQKLSYNGGISIPNFLYHTSFLSGILVNHPRDIIPVNSNPAVILYGHSFNNSIRPRSPA